MRYVLLFFLVWVMTLALIWPLGPEKTPSLLTQEIVAAGLIALIAAAFFGRAFAERPLLAFNPLRLFWFLVFLPVFFEAVLRANLDVAYRVLHRDLPIRPGIIRVTTTLKTDIARTMLANSITLTPGTMVVDLRGDTMYVHCLYVYSADREQATADIARRFEGLLKRIFE